MGYSYIMSNATAAEVAFTSLNPTGMDTRAIADRNNSEWYMANLGPFRIIVDYFGKNAAGQKVYHGRLFIPDSDGDEMLDAELFEDTAAAVKMRLVAIAKAMLRDWADNSTLEQI